MKLTLRILAAVLALITLCTCFAACKDEEIDGTEETTAAEIDGTEEDTLSEEDLMYMDELPELNYNKTEIGVLSRNVDICSDEFLDNAGPNEVSAAVYTRNLNVEERLNVLFSYYYDEGTSDDSLNKTLNIAVSGGDDTYQMVLAPTYVATKYVVRGDYVNLNRADNLNLDKLYWSQGFNEIYSYSNNKQYLATGSAAITLYRLMFVTIYNKDMFNQRSVADPYDLVKSSDWTVEKQLQLSQQFYVENGADTIYGLSTGYKICVDPYWVSMDINIIDKDEANLFVSYSTDGSVREKLNEAVTDIRALYLDQATTVLEYDKDGTNTETIVPFFEERAAMATVMCYHIEKYLNDLGELKDKYAIVPMPKYDKEQKEYYSCIQDQVTAYGISAAVKDDATVSMIGAVMEAIAAESHRIVVPEYYEKRLSVRYLTDERSTEMMKLTYEGARISMGAAYTGILLESENKGFSTMMRELIGAKGNIVSSTFRNYGSKLNMGVTNLNGRLEALA